MKNTVFIVFILLLGISCSDDSGLGEFGDKAKVLAQGEGYSIGWVENNEEIKFVVEDEFNTSDNRFSTDGSMDFLRILVDANNNNQLDSLVDMIYSVSNDGAPCKSLMLTETSITPCEVENGFEVDAIIAASDRYAEAHVICIFTIRKEFLFRSNDEVGLVFIMSGADSAGQVPFSSPPTFSETIIFN